MTLDCVELPSTALKGCRQSTSGRQDSHCRRARFTEFLAGFLGTAARSIDGRHGLRTYPSGEQTGR